MSIVFLFRGSPLSFWEKYVCPPSCSLPLLPCPLCPVFVSYFLPFIPLGQIILLWEETLVIIGKPIQTKIIIILQSKVVNQSETVVANGNIKLVYKSVTRSIQHEWWLSTLNNYTLEPCTQHAHSWSLGNPVAQSFAPPRSGYFYNFWEQPSCIL